MQIAAFFRILAGAFGLWCLATALVAQTLIRDSEIEEVLNDLTLPLLQAAGRSSGSVRIYLIDDPSLNAFVAGGDNIFIHTGLIRRLERADMLQAVIAHEIGHIVSGHLAQRVLSAEAAQNVSALGIILGLLAGAAGSAEAAIAIAAGSQTTAQRGYLAHSRAQESSADQSSVRILERAGIDPQALVDVLEIFRGQDLLRTERQDEYVRTHPVSQTRITQLSDLMSRSQNRGDPVPADLAERYERIRAKLDGFLVPPSQILRRETATATDMPTRIRRAIALHREPNPAAALAAVDALIRSEPRNAFFHELRGQFLFENRDPSAAVASYRTALTLRSQDPLLLVALGEALLSINTDQSRAEALRVLETAHTRTFGSPRSLRSLAVARARAGNEGGAALASAERFLLTRQFPDAQRFARQALAQLQQGSPGWRRAQDIDQLMTRILE